VVRWLQRKGVKSLAHLSEQELRLAYDYYRSREPNVGSAVHILNRFFSERGIIAEGEPPPRSPTELELDHFAQYLCGVRGLVMSTVAVHTSRLRCFLQFLGFDQNPHTEARALAPIQELADGMIVSDPRVLVADGNGKKFEVSLGRFRADIGDERWNLEGFGFDET
jgi:hypothetical protein